MDRRTLHPSGKELLLFVDGELRKRQAAAIERHLASCWECRASLAGTEDAINEFVTLRRKLLDQRLESADLPPARNSRAILLARMAERAGAGHTVGRWRFALTYRPLWTAGSVVALLMVLLLVVEPLVAPGVSAMEVIAHGQAAEQQRPPGMVLHQRVRIQYRQRTKPAAAAVDCDLWKNARRSRMLVVAGHSDPMDRLRAFFQSRGVDWESPLSVTSFAKLRSSLGPVRDEVRVQEQITVTSTPASDANAGGEVKRLQMTVRRSDWHAISQRIELRDADFELTELLDEKLAGNKIDPAIFAEPPMLAAAPLPPPPRRMITAPPASPVPSSEQLDDTEIELREALHQTWADVEEVPEIQREGNRLRVRVFTQTSQRRQEILAALAGIQSLTVEISDAQTREPEAPAASASASSPAPAPYSTKPPLAKALEEYSGGLEPANSYLNAVRDSYLEVLVEASALARLAERYRDTEWNRLPAEAQRRLNRIAEDHVAAVRTNLRNYLRLVSPVLDEMAARHEFNVRKRAGATDAGCVSWRSESSALVANLQHLETAFRRLFVEERTEQPLELSEAELLSQSLESRSQLQQLCQP